jgi:hypothetical protein
MKRAVDESAAKVEEEAEEVSPIHWKDASAALADLKVVGCDLLGNKFGWVLKRLLNGKERFLVQGPPCEVVFAPAYQDPTKFKNNPSQPDPKRKRDKWNTTLKTHDLAFARFCNQELRKAALQHMFDARESWGGGQFSSPAELTATLPNVIDLDKDTGDMTFSLDLTAARDAPRPDLVLRDYETQALLPEEATLGQHSIVVPIIDFSDVFVGRSAKSKQWAKMPVAFVRQIVNDKKVEPKSIKLAKRDD